VTNLLSLAERVEQASAEDQRHLIEQAAAQLALHQLWPPKADDTALAARFFAFLNAGAFLDAAMTLVPEGWNWRLESWRLVASAKLQRDNRVLGGDATTPALALTAACLRTHALSLSGNQP
jgi:hypothetical protein